MTAIEDPDPTAPAAPGAPAEGAHPHSGTVLRGLVWLGGVRWAAQLFTWASTLIIARLLTPEDYGLVAMATVMTGFLEVVTDIGLGAALVQARQIDGRDVEATMGATLLLGAGAAILVALSAPLWAQVQGDARIIPIVRALAIGVLLTTAGAVPYSMLHRRLAFGRVAQAQFARGLITAVATLGLALVLQSHWALVIGYLIARACFTLFLIWVEPVRPRLPGPDTHVGRLLRFGGLLTGDRVFNYLRANLDIALVGALLGGRVLGLYVMALALARLPLEKLGSAFEPVAYPTFSRLQDNAPELRRYFLALSLGTMAIAVPASLGLIVTADLLVPTVIGRQWSAAVRPLQVAALFTPIAFHLTIVAPLMNALGRVDLNLRITIITSILTVPAVLLGLNWGIVGVAAAVGVVFTITAVYGELLAYRLIDLRVREIVQTLLPVVTASIGMAASVAVLGMLLPVHWPAAVRLLLEIGGGVIAYAGWAMLLHQGVVLKQLRSLRAAWGTR